MNGVYLCKDNYLMDIPGTPTEEKVTNNLRAINAFAAAHPNMGMYMTIVPNAVTILSEKLPSNAPVRVQTEDIKGFQDQLKGITFWDVTDALFKDSYTNCFIQFLYPHFDHITMIDPRYYYDKVEAVIKSESITDVLFLYNANTFLLMALWLMSCWHKVSLPWQHTLF